VAFASLGSRWLARQAERNGVGPVAELGCRAGRLPRLPDADATDWAPQAGPPLSLGRDSTIAHTPFAVQRRFSALISWSGSCFIKRGTGGPAEITNRSGTEGGQGVLIPPPPPSLPLRTPAFGFAVGSQKRAG
jgi:hypothetical protein